MKKILNGATIISSVFILICYGLFLIISIAQSSDISTILLCVTVIALALIPLIFKKKMWLWLRWIFCIGMCFYMISFFIFCGYIFSDVNDNVSIETIARDNELIVMVYGCRTYDYPSKALRERLNAALELLNAYPESLCIVTGGQGSNEPITEAESMQRYLIENGIDESRIITEPKASSTVENIEFTQRIIEENNLQDYYKVVGVSSDYHLRRISILCDAANFDTILVPASSPDKIMLLSNLVREYMSYVKMFLLHL